MNIAKISKVLTNETRLSILHWLQSPEEHFPPHQELGHFEDGVCALFITDKCGLSASTVSHYLSMMQEAGLIVATRHGKWTYFKRDEDFISRYTQHLTDHL